MLCGRSGKGSPVRRDSGPGGAEVVVGLGVGGHRGMRCSRRFVTWSAGLLAGFEVVAELHEFVDLRHDAFLLRRSGGRESALTSRDCRSADDALVR